MRDNYQYQGGDTPQPDPRLQQLAPFDQGTGNLERAGFRPMPPPPGADWLPPQVLAPPSDQFLPPQVPGLFDRLPPSRWIDLQAVDNIDRNGNLVRQFNDGNRVVIAGNPPQRILVMNDVITKDLTLDANGRIIQAVEINNATGFSRVRPDCQGAIVDGYGAMHGVNGRVERRNGFISPNERAYVQGLINGFPERWAYLPNNFNHHGGYRPAPYFPHRPHYTPRYHRGR
ncbi:MAG: hypothetical protein K2W95_19810 [Candidatus Obscuribacterales bacterium]|nr:hypothetical protein [Candidatus Obscuribacterales bacterium]